MAADSNRRIVDLSHEIVARDDDPSGYPGAVDLDVPDA